MNEYKVSVEVGYEIRSVILSAEEYRLVCSGKPLVRNTEELYEGERFTYTFSFNTDPDNALTVTYDSGVGFLGDLSDAFIEEIE